MILDGLSLPPEAPREMYVLPQMLADLSGAAGPDELTGEAAALSRFKVCFPPVSVSLANHACPPPADCAGGLDFARGAEPPGPPRSGLGLVGRRSGLGLGGRRLGLVGRPLGLVGQRLGLGGRRAGLRGRVRVAAGTAAATFVLGGAAAAYAGVLPAPVQNFVHQMFGAPPAQPVSRHVSRITSPASQSLPDATVSSRAKNPGKPADPDHRRSSSHQSHSGDQGSQGSSGPQGGQSGSGQQGSPGHHGGSSHHGNPGHRGSSGQQGNHGNPGRQGNHGNQGSPHRSPSSHPAQPGHPSHPGHPAHPGHPGHPGHPVRHGGAPHVR